MAPGRRLNIGEAPVALPQIRIHVWPTWAFVFGKRGDEMAGSQKETRTAGDEEEVQGLPVLRPNVAGSIWQAKSIGYVLPTWMERDETRRSSEPRRRNWNEWRSG